MRSLLFEGENTPLKPTQAKWVRKVISLLTADGSAVEDDVLLSAPPTREAGRLSPRRRLVTKKELGVAMRRRLTKRRMRRRMAKMRMRRMMMP